MAAAFVSKVTIHFIIIAVHLIAWNTLQTGKKGMSSYSKYAINAAHVKMRWLSSS